MKKIELLAIVIVILALVSSVTSMIYQYFIMRLLPVEEIGKITMVQSAFAISAKIIRSLVEIGIGVWLFAVAKKEKNAMPWLWGLFGLFFRLIAVVLFYVIKIYENINAGRLKVEEGF